LNRRSILRLATVNILHDRSRWPERRRLLARELEARSPDLIALQEVVDPLGPSTAHWLAGELGGYEVLVCPKAGWGRSREGIAVLSRLPVEDHSTLDLGSQQRMAQFVRVRISGWPVVLVNGHYYWPPGAHESRARQVGRVLDRLGAVAPGTSAIVCGDFNGLPGTPAIDLMRRTFVSAHEARHGREPDYTCPTPLVGGPSIRSAITRGALRLFTNRPGESWRGTLDYIFVSPDIRVLDCGVFLDRPAAEDPGLYASDHLGLVATLEVVGGGNLSSQV
jgi:endonuclease/exonuclease/phosphatase family metal-dependent hydrolase